MDVLISTTFVKQNYASSVGDAVFSLACFVSPLL